MDVPLPCVIDDYARLLCLAQDFTAKSKYRLLPVAASTRDSAANSQSRELRRPSDISTRNPPQGIRAAATNKTQCKQP